MPSLNTIGRRLQHARSVHVAIGVAASGISYGLARTNLVPEQALIVSTAGSILVFVALLYVLVFDQDIRHLQRGLVHLAMVAVCGLVLLHLFFVKTVYNYGARGETRRFLVGATLNGQGRADLGSLGATTVDQLIQFAGADGIPSWYGWDYSLVLVAYVASYLAFVVSTVLAVGVLAIQRLPPLDGRLQPTGRDRDPDEPATEVAAADGLRHTENTKMSKIKTRVLLVCANPRGSDPLRTAEEDRTLRESLKLSPHGSRIEVDTLNAATIDDLRRALLRTQYQVVHFSGHGTQSGLVFEDSLGRLMIPSSSALAELLARRNVPTVVLNACYSLSLGRLTSVGVDYTIASSGPIADPAAIEFTRGFYDAVGAGLLTPAAFDEGVTCAKLKGFHPEVILLRRGEIHEGKAPPEAGPADRLQQTVLVGIALDTSGSMRESIRNHAGGTLSRLEGAQRALRRLGESVQCALQKSARRGGDAAGAFRVFAYAFGLRDGGVADIFSLLQASRTLDIGLEVEKRREAYTNQATERAAGYGGLASLARQYGFGDVVDGLAAGARSEAERTIRERITREVSELLFSRAAAAGDATMSAGALAALASGESDLAADSIEPLIYGSTPMRKAANAIAERFGRTENISEAEKRILIVISDGEPTDGDPSAVFDNIEKTGVTVVSCFVTDADVAEPRSLVASPQTSWSSGAKLMFQIASRLNERDPLARELLAQGWTIEDGAKLFVQVNHSDVLGEFVRAMGADFNASDFAILPEGR